MSAQPSPLSWLCAGVNVWILPGWILRGHPLLKDFARDFARTPTVGFCEDTHCWRILREILRGHPLLAIQIYTYHKYQKVDST